MPIEKGTRLGQYEVQDFIGQGAMGVVYRAYHVQLARTGAVKVMQAIAPDEDSIARFRREAQAIAQMRHPNILNVFDFGDYEGMPYMIVEYVPGGSLASKLKHGPMDNEAALEFLDGLASGLDYAHSLGIVHRDVKPANVLIAKDGTPILADFGLAKLLQSSSVKSMTGVTTGTPAYMAPEQVTGSQVGPPADRYSLATMAYEMLTGSIPFDDEGVLELLYAQVHREPPVPSSRRPELGPRVDAVIMRGLAKDPNARWESCEAFGTALRQALAGSGTRAVERTVVMAPPAAKVPFARSSSPATSPSAVAVAPVLSPMPSYRQAPAAAAPTPLPRVRKSHRVRNTIAIALGILLWITVAFVAVVAATAPAMSLSSSSLPAGDHLVVSARRLPANQVGEIQLLSQLRVFPFRADGSGNVSVDIVVPRDIGTGDHLVKVCWGSACHITATLHVTAPAALPTPSALPSGSPTAAPSGSPRATPTSSVTPTPTHPGTSPSPAPVISISNSQVKRNTGTQTVYGLHFQPGSTVTITFVQGSTTNKQVGTANVSSSGYFQLTFTLPSSATPGPAAVKVCGTSGCLYATFEVIA